MILSPVSLLEIIELVTLTTCDINITIKQNGFFLNRNLLGRSFDSIKLIWHGKQLGKLKSYHMSNCYTKSIDVSLTVMEHVLEEIFSNINSI